jgi:trimethylamine-N-oxide reductase (cytochrome c)
MQVNGDRYWILRMNTQDAARRGLTTRDLVKVYNARGAVLCAVDVSELVSHGVVRAHESSAELELIDTPAGRVDRGGCMNLLTSGRSMSATADGITPNSCLVEVEAWHEVRASA